MLIDTHCHIHDSEFYGPQRETVYSAAISSGVERLICVGTSSASSRQALEFAASHEHAYAAIGVHPHDAKDGWSQIAELADLARAGSKLVAIGEIGLDYFYNHSSRAVQIEALEAQLHLATRLQLPVSFHVRSAFDDFWPIFDNFQSVRGVLHSFTDTQANLDKGLERGLFVGVNGISTFTKDVAQQELFTNLPLPSMLLETDAPFLAPVPKRGKVNQPAYLVDVAQDQASRRGLDPSEIARQTTANANELFNLK